MYDVWMRNYPQPDINLTEELDLSPFKTLAFANAFIEHMEKMYADDEWKGHRMYKAKFYAEKVK